MIDLIQKVKSVTKVRLPPTSRSVGQIAGNAMEGSLARYPE
jgi:hypothetical protein